EAAAALFLHAPCAGEGVGVQRRAIGQGSTNGLGAERHFLHPGGQRGGVGGTVVLGNGSQAAQQGERKQGGTHGAMIGRAGTRWARSVPGGMGTRKRAYVNVGLGLDNGSAQWFNEPSTLEGSSAPLGQLVPHLSRMEGDTGAPCTEPALSPTPNIWNMSCKALLRHSLMPPCSSCSCETSKVPGLENSSLSAQRSMTTPP